MGRVRHLILRLDPGPRRTDELSRFYALFAVPLLALVLIAMGWPTGHGGLRDLAGRTFGHDFSQVWVAGRTALDGQAASVYDVAAHDRAQIAAFGPGADLFAWHYPPVFLMPAALAGLLPVPAAVLAWGLLSAGAMALVLRAILGSWRGALVGLAFPSVFDCLGYGQNGLLTASLLGGGLLVSTHRPYLGGMLIGLTCYKPQLLAVVPLVLLAGGYGRVALASALTAFVASAASVALFGLAPWSAFLRGLADTNADIFQDGWAGFALNASAFGAVRLLGGGTVFAWMVQAAVALLALGLTLVAWHRGLCAPLRHALVLALVPLASPYVPVYDLAVLVPAGAFLLVAARLRDGPDAFERLAALALFVPAFDPRGFADATHLPIGFLMAVTVFVLVARRVRRQLGRGQGRDGQRHAARSLVEP